jgi:hypothetical protein
MRIEKILSVTPAIAAEVVDKVLHEVDRTAGKSG